MKPLLLVILLCYVFGATSQTSDSFADGDFSANPAWLGDDSLFRVNESFQLQSKGTIAKDLSLSTPSNRLSGEWHFWCRFNLSPSASNFMRVYLMSDSVNLKGSLNGYYVQLGGVTGNSDSITLYKQKGMIRTRVIGGRMGTVSKTNNLVGVKVLRDTLGNWQLFSDTAGGNAYVPEGAGMDNELIVSRFLGLFIRFTGSNAQNYFLDEVYAGHIIIDSIPPVLDSVQVLSPLQLRLIYNEPVSGISGLDTSNYHVDKGMGQPESVQFEFGRRDVVLLMFAKAMIDGQYEINVKSVADVAGNVLKSQVSLFKYHNLFTIRSYDLLISEFFPDPTPVIGLPEQEFIELYNNSDHDIRLLGSVIADETASATFSDLELKQDSFLIVCSEEHVPLFAPFGKVAGLKGMPSLNNNGDHILLKDKTGNIIHQLKYDLSWYHDPLKSNGGSSIELISPKQLCKGEQNYRACTFISGGTPGFRNSNWNSLPDTALPHIKTIAVMNEQHMLLVFDEQMDSLSLINGSFTFTPPNFVVSAITGSASFDSLYLELANPLTKNTLHAISISGVRDCSGNMLAPLTTFSFTYIAPDTARQYDILINEVLADPDPVIGLPDAEYIELYNRSDRIISLRDWTLSDAGSVTKMPDRILMPDNFLVITAANNLSKFSGMEGVVGVINFPSLGNDGDALVLKNEMGNTIHYLIYSASAYRDHLKKNGGWSLELVDKDNPCGGDGNLLASRSVSGGTPGRKNSVDGIRHDQRAPELISAYPLNEKTLELRFNELLDSVSQTDTNKYKVNHGLEHPVAVMFCPPGYNKIAIELADSIQKHLVYRVTVRDIRDCAGNTIEEADYVDWGLPEKADSNDIVINEILFDPRGTGSDFVELMNRSDHILDVKDLSIANTNEDNSIRDFYPVDSNGLLILPQNYLVLTENPSNIRTEYKVERPEQMIKCRLPSYSNDEGHCVIVDKKGIRYDQLDYTSKMHFALIDDPDGVSLERIDFNRPASDRSNWTSASSTSGYATPTSRNSQYAFVQQKGNITAEPEIFSPDGDGYHDVISFRYTLDEPGFTGDFFIYNSSGRMIKRLWRNELLGVSGVISWDGITDDGSKAPIGIYLCHVEWFNLKGEVHRHKMTIVVGAKL